MSKLAKHIIIRRGEIEIDGEVLPWYILEGPEITPPSRREMACVTISIPAEKIEVLDPAPKVEVKETSS